MPDPTTQRLRVLFIPQWYPSESGDSPASGIFCREHVRAAALYDDVAVLTFFSRSERWPTLKLERFVDDGIPTFNATYGHSPIPRTTFPFFRLHLRRAIRQVLRLWGWPNLIHTQDMHAFYVIKAAQKFGIPVVMSQHSSALRKRDLDRRTVYRLRWAFARATQVLHVNRWAIADYDHYGLKADFRWLPNTVDTRIFYPPPEPNRQPWLLHVSGFTPQKRFPDVLRAFGTVRQLRPQAQLHVVGETRNRPAAEALAVRELPRDSFHFHGFLTKTRLAKLMRQASGLVLTSEFETFGCVLIESMACGCPVLTTKVGGIPAVIREDEGLFVEVGDIPAIVDGMVAMLDGAHRLNLEKVTRDTRRRFSYPTIGLLLHQAHLAASSGLQLQAFAETF